MKYRKSCGEVGVTPQLFTYGKLLRSMDEVKPRSCSMAQPCIDEIKVGTFRGVE